MIADATAGGRASEIGAGRAAGAGAVEATAGEQEWRTSARRTGDRASDSACRPRDPAGRDGPARYREPGVYGEEVVY